MKENRRGLIHQITQYRAMDHAALVLPAKISRKKNQVAITFPLRYELFKGNGCQECKTYVFRYSINFSLFIHSM